MTTSQALRFVVVALLAAVAMASLPAAVAQETGTTITVPLQEYKGSGFTGTAVLSETTTGGTHVSMELHGGALQGNHPTHIHTGTCDDFDPNPLYPLETINLSSVSHEGVSETDVEGVSIDTLTSGDYVILVHLSPEQLTTYLVCGDISLGTVGVGDIVVPTGNTSEAHHLPSTGAGTPHPGDGSISRLVIALSLLALVSLAGACVLRLSRR